MKKSVIIAALGIAGFAASTYGQGIIAFDTYLGHYAGGSIAPVSFFTSPSTIVGTGFTAELFYALGTVTDPVSNSAASITQAIGAQFTALPASVTPVLANGYIQDASPVTISAYSSGAITFEIALTGPGGFTGRSGSFTESSINPSGSASTFFGDNGTGPSQMLVAGPVPEPTTLALAGLGGLASLVALRRKQA